MENSINFLILIPSIPLFMSLVIFILLRTFNRTVNRLTKPASYLTLFSILFPTVLSSFYLYNNVEGQIYLSNYLSIFQGSNLEFHLNSMTEKLIILLGIIISLVIIFSLIKLPRKTGYVLYIVNLGFLTAFSLSILLFI